LIKIVIDRCQSKCQYAVCLISCRCNLAAFTGSPNGALLSSRALVLQGSLIAQIQGVGADYVYLNCGPLFHVATFMTTLATFLVGGNNVFTPRVDAEELCRLIADEGCTGGFIMGPTMDQIIELNADGRYNLKTLRSFAGKPAVEPLTGNRMMRRSLVIRIDQQIHVQHNHL